MSLIKIQGNQTESSGGGGGVSSIVAGTNVTIDSTIPTAPIINVPGFPTNLSTDYTSSVVIIMSDTGTDAQIEKATSSFAGVMSANDKVNLDNQSGVNTGDQTSVTGNSGTATALQTARTIAGQSFDGTANITAANLRTGLNVADGATANQSDAVTNAAINGKENTITPGTTGQFWSWNKTWQSFASSVWGTVLTGLSLASGIAVTATDNVLVAIGKLQRQINDNLTSINTLRQVRVKVNQQTAITSTNEIVGISMLVPTGRTAENMEIDISATISRTGVNTSVLKTYISTTNLTVGSVAPSISSSFAQLSIYNLAAGFKTAFFERSFNLLATKIQGFASNITLLSDRNASGGIMTLNDINYAADYWIVFTITGGAGDSFIFEKTKLIY